MASCYRTLEGMLFNFTNTEVPCSNSTPTGCCAYGDFCLSNGICRYANPSPGESGYYLQASTDQTFQSSIGQETFHCTTDDIPDIAYNATSGLWACCSGNMTAGVNCGVPTNETFAGPAPAALSIIATIQQALVTAPPTTSSSNTRTTSVISPSNSSKPATSSTTSASSTGSPSPTMPPSNTPSTLSTIAVSTIAVSTSSNTAAAASTSSSTPSRSTHKAGLSAGAIAGISVGSVGAVVTLIALILLAVTVIRKRRRNRPGSPGLFGGPDPTLEGYKDALFEARTQVGSEASLAHSYRPPGFTGEPQFPQEVFKPARKARRPGT